MRPDALKTFCLELNGAVETFPFTAETSVFKVGGKIFAITALEAEPLSVSLKCEPEIAVRRRGTHPEITPAGISTSATGTRCSSTARCPTPSSTS